MAVMRALLRVMLVGLGLSFVQAVAAFAALYAGLSPWWSLLLLPACLLAWGVWRTAAWLWRRRARTSRGGQVPRNASLEQAWRRALQRSAAGVRSAELPWFMMLGRPGSGKSTALARARIPSPLSPVRGDSDEAGGVAWWYTDRLVVMDCGDALPGPDAAPDFGGDWDYHLRMLRRHRRHQGIDGVVLTLSARYLIDADSDQISHEARATRARLEQLIVELGERFPVYVLLTHCDTLYGFEAWTRLLGDDRLQHAMGYLAEVDATDQDFVRRAFDTMGDRLERLRWRLLADGHVASPELLMFPRELRELQAPLQGFADNCLAAHPYLERLLLRGLFFSSARQPGGASSRVIGHDVPPTPKQSDRHQGVFLRGVFGDVLPAERGLRRPSSAALRLRTRRARLLLGLWLAFAALAAGTLSLSFLTNLRALDGLRSAEARFGDARAGLVDPLAALLEQQAAIVGFENRGDSALARLTLQGSGWQDLLARQKRGFVEASRARLNANSASPGLPTDADADADASTQRAVEVVKLLRLASVLQARAGGASLQQLQAMPAPFVLHGEQPDQTQTLRWQLELAQIAWTGPADPQQRARLLRVRARLDRLALQDPQLGWLARVPRLDGVPPLRVAHAWDRALPQDDGPQTAGSPMPELAPEFTAVGYADMDKLARQWRAVSAEPARVDLAWSQFRRDWRQRQEQAARAALEQALAAPPPMRGAAQWRAALPELASADNPYWRFNDELLRQLAASQSHDASEGRGNVVPAPAGVDAATSQPGGQAPTWLVAAREFALWRSAASADLPSRGALDVLRSLGSRSLQSAVKADAGAAARSVEGPIRGARELRDYVKALDQLAQQLEQGDAQATAVAADFLAYGNNPRVTKSVAADAMQALQAVRTRLRGAALSEAPGAAAGRASPDAFGAGRFPIDQLLDAPWRALMQYADATAGCTLQQRWQSEVLWPLQTAGSRDEMLRQVYGPQGTLWNFVNGPAAPFLQRNAQIYRVVRREGQELPFTPAFLGALNGAARRQAEQARQQVRTQQAQTSLQATEQRLEQARKALATAQQAHAVVSITALPSDVEPNGAQRVYSTRLSLPCASGVTQLDNLNLPQQRSLEWSPQSCNGTTLRIAIGDLLLERQYPGPLGFADFLAAFRDGTHAFTPGDFPLQAQALRGLGIAKIILHYRFDGADTVVNAARALRQSQQEEQQLQDAVQRLQAAGGAQLATGAVTAASAPAPVQAAPLDGLTLSALGLPASIASCWNDPKAASP